MPKLKALSAAIIALTAPSVFASVEMLDKGLDWGNCDGPLEVVQPPEGEGEVSDAIYLEADGAELFPDERLVQMSGNVVAQQGELEIRAQQLKYTEPTGRIQVDGGVYFKSPGVRLTGDNADIDLVAEHAEMNNAEYRLPQQHARGSATRVELLSRSRSHLEGLGYTTCAPDDDGWLLEAGTLDLDRDSGVGVARDATLAFQGVPFFYTPYIQFPIDDRRMSGLLIPTVRYADRTGLDISIPYYFNIAPNMDATFHPRILSESGLMLGGRVRYKSLDTDSDLDMEWIADDSAQQPGLDESRMAAGFDGTGHLPGSGRYRIDLNYVSDNNYLDDFGDSLAVTAETHLMRRGDVVYQGKDWRLLGRLDYFQTIDDTIAAEDRPYARLPQLLYTLNKKDLWSGLQAGFRGEYVYFDRSTGVTGHRADLMPSLSYPMESVWGFLRPKVSLRYTAYDLNDVNPGTDETPDRTLSTVSLDGGLYFERSGNWFGHAITQTLEPRLFYLRTPYRDQDGLPDFDTGLASFGFSSLFRENRFNGSDRVGDANQLALALSSRMLDDETGEERLRGSVGSIFYFDDRKVQLDSAQVEDESGSALVAEVAAKISDHWDLRAGIDQCDAGVVVDRLGVHRVDHGNLVGDRRRVGDQVAHPGAALTALPHRRNRTTDQELLLAGGHPGNPLPTSDTVRQLAAMQFL